MIKEILIPVPSGVVTDIDGNQDKCTHIKCTLGYEIGGYSCFTGEANRRGYYLYVRAVNRKDYGEGLVSESYALLHGRKELLVECGRRSAKKEAEAIGKFEQCYARLITSVFPEVALTAVA